jgi:hypothetical protein
LLETNPDEASAVTLASLDTGDYRLRIRVDLRCVPKNVIDITQRDDYGSYSPPREFKAPNGFEDGSAPPGVGPTCNDAGASDNGADGGEAGAGDASSE